MTKFLAALMVALVAAVGALLWSLSPEVLPDYENFAVALPASNPPPEMTLHALHAGRMKSNGAFAYRGGGLGDERTFGMDATLIRHPRGTLLIDTGFGRSVDTHVKFMPPLMRALTKYETETPVAAQLAAAGIPTTQLAGVLLTHAHWDHVSGLEDLPGVPVWVPQAELDFIRSRDAAVNLIASFGALNYRTYDFPDGPYLGFDKSFDVFKDGAVVVVPAPGHTPGSVIVFVTPLGEQRYAFVGDLVWQREGIDIPAQRPWLSRQLVDKDEAQVRRWVLHMHRLQKAVPGLQIVPAHDRRVHETLPRLASGATAVRTENS